MLYLVAFLLSPLAVFLCGKPIQGIVNAVVLIVAWAVLLASFFILTPIAFIIWIIAVVHALLVAHNYYADKRTAKVVEAMRETRDRAPGL